jgi:hypothetical protein
MASWSRAIYRDTVTTDKSTTKKAAGPTSCRFDEHLKISGLTSY